MPLSADALPRPTPFDPADDPPSSVDPLGTLAYAEHLAEVLLPGLTSRMWRARFLTLAAVASHVAERVVALMNGREEVRLEARLAFERLYVAAVMRLHSQQPEEWNAARRRLPGSDLARRALLADEPLARGNFLKGQAVNGPCGVLATLARHLEIVDDEGQPSTNASNVLLAWARDEGLPAVLDEDGGRERAGSAWMTDATKVVVALLTKRVWPGATHRIWEQLASKLRPDRAGANERRILADLLDRDEVRRRVFAILRAATDQFQEMAEAGRGEIERTILLRVVKPALGTDPTDRAIRAAVVAIEAYESASGLLQQAFETLLWGLKQRGGRAAPATLLSDRHVGRSLASTASSLRRAVATIDGAVDGLSAAPALDSPAFKEPLSRLREEIAVVGESSPELVQALMRRHERVQREKRKGTWIDFDAQWTLKPGFGVGGDAPPRYEGRYLHPFRIGNAYSLMAGVGRVSVRVLDAEA